MLQVSDVRRSNKFPQFGDIPLDFDVFIRRDKLALKIYLGFAIFVILFGLLLVVISLVFGPVFGEGLQRSICTIGGGFVATLSAFPLKEYMTRYERIGVLRSLDARRDVMSLEERERARQLISKLYEKYVLG